MDFTLKTYCSIILSIKNSGYEFQTFENFITKPKERVVVLRHDVDRLPANALKIAKIEHEHSIQASYYFRIVKNVWDEKIIKEIASLGHEVAYHYEDLSLCKGNIEKAIKHFEHHLEKIRYFYPVKTICMHGSPMSKWDNRNLWKSFNYKDYGILGEPYFDVDYKKVFYITDTGRSWKNEDFNVRDIVDSGFNINVKNSKHLIKLIVENKLPSQIIINTHPHRWFRFGVGWINELIMQNVKNIIKRIIVKTK